MSGSPLPFRRRLSASRARCPRLSEWRRVEPRPRSVARQSRNAGWRLRSGRGAGAGLQRRGAALLSDDECGCRGRRRRGRPFPKAGGCWSGPAGRPRRRPSSATRRAFDAGADAVLVVTPSYYRGRMDGEALAASLPVGWPRRGWRPAASLPRSRLHRRWTFRRRDGAGAGGSIRAIVGMKDSSGRPGPDRATGGATRPPASAVLVGNAADPARIRRCRHGAVGAVLAVACVAPEACCRPVGACASRHGWSGPKPPHLQERLTPLARAVTASHGIPGPQGASRSSSGLARRAGAGTVGGSRGRLSASSFLRVGSTFQATKEVQG